MTPATHVDHAARDVIIDLGAYPGISRFALDLVRGDAAPRRFLRGRADVPQALPDAALIDALDATNRSWGNDVRGALDEWAKGESVTLIAGQQVGFGGGPLYTLSKIASLLHLRQRLRESGKKATVFFWMATEDHDVAEVSSLALWQGDELHHLRAIEHPNAAYAVGRLALPRSLRVAYEKLTGETPQWLRDGITYRDSFAELLSEVLEDQEVILVDAMLPELRRAGGELFLRVVDQHAEIQATLAQRAREIESAGYNVQVAPHQNGEYGLLFLLRANGQRDPITHDAGTWRVGEHPISFADLRALVAAQPESVSTGALLRPLLQDLVFQTGSFVGGPAEVSYYAQSSSLHALLGVRESEVLLRGHVLVAPSKRLRALERYEVDASKIFGGSAALLSPLESDRLRRSEEVIADAKNALDATTRALDDLLASTDESVRASVARSEKHLHYHIEKLRERTRRAVLRRDAERHRAIDKTVKLLLPEGQPQDRVVGWISFWRTYGSELVSLLVDAAVPQSQSVRIIGL